MLKKAQAVLGYDLLKLCLEGPKEQLDETRCVHADASRRVAALMCSFPDPLAGLNCLRPKVAQRLEKCMASWHEWLEELAGGLGVLWQHINAIQCVQINEGVIATMPRYAQPALFVAGLAAVEALRKDSAATVEGCSVTAGLSLGEYTALVFAGALSFEDGLKVYSYARGSTPCTQPAAYELSLKCPCVIPQMSPCKPCQTCLQHVSRRS